MKTVNFKNFKMFKDITQEETVEVDARREIADSIYKNSAGIMAHDLALRIYRSEGAMELSDEEAGFLEDFASRGTPLFTDSMKANITETREG